MVLLIPYDVYLYLCYDDLPRYMRNAEMVDLVTNRALVPESIVHEVGYCMYFHVRSALRWVVASTSIQVVNGKYIW